MNGKQEEYNVMEFEWDAAKAASNRKKHRVDFHEAATVLVTHSPLRLSIRAILRMRTGLSLLGNRA
jgi:hypothetical protein